jgi:hypothetical protein
MICKVKKNREGYWMWDIQATERDTAKGFYPFRNCAAFHRFNKASDAAIDLMRHLVLIENKKPKGKK